MEISDAGIGYNSKLGRLFQIKHMSVPKSGTVAYL